MEGLRWQTLYMHILSIGLLLHAYKEEQVFVRISNEGSPEIISNELKDMYDRFIPFQAFTHTPGFPLHIVSQTSVYKVGNLPL